MKKIILIFWLFATVSAAEAQVLINLQLPSAGISVKPQLWSLTLVNTGTPRNVRVDMTFTDIVNNQLVFTASTRELLLSQQITPLQANDLVPIIYNVVNSSYSVDANPNGFLPIGTFEVCYAVMVRNGEGFDKIAEECETIDVEPVSPPILMEPADEDSIYQVRPFFTWIPPAPFTAFHNLSYDYTLVEVGASQTPADAIQQNTPLYAGQNLQVNSLLYPPSVPALDTGKIYAWQVAAKSSNNAISKSEVWTFKIKRDNDSLPAELTNGNYVPLINRNEAGYSTLTNDLRFEYLNELNDTSVIFNFYDITTAARSVIGTDTAFKRLHFGQNFILIRKEELPSLINKHIYLFELINSKSEKWYMKFEFRKPENN